RGDIEMIVVIVADEREIDRWQVFEAKARRAVAAGTGEADRRGALGPDRIGEDVDPVELQERGRMIDERDAKLTIADTAGRWRSERHVCPRVPAAAIARQHPFDEGSLALPSRPGIVEVLAIEVIGDRPAIAGRGDEAAFDRCGRSGRAGGDGDCL